MKRPGNWLHTNRNGVPGFLLLSHLGLVDHGMAKTTRFQNSFFLKAIFSSRLKLNYLFNHYFCPTSCFDLFCFIYLHKVFHLGGERHC